MVLPSPLRCLLAVAGLALTMFVRTATVFIAHIMDSRAEAADIAGVERWHFIGMALQGLRVAIPALLLLLIPAHLVQSGLEAMPEWLKSGMTIGWWYGCSRWLCPWLST